ncbi:MAG TPA: WYL domain-containing protein [Candidatus Dormibacteraeota bacterium]|nr:WYL domain-containing protein [Candidatus Dormibacteraeota bacterium]
MRADRLLSILLLLQARGGMSAPDLARELEVSVRTVFRDVDALSAAGVPVYAERGAGGGIRLLAGYQTDLTGVSAKEAQALLLLGIPGPLDELGLSAHRGAAERKLLAALPPPARGDAERTRDRVHIDPAGWDRPASDIAHLAAITDATFRDRRLRLAYERGDGRRVTRDVDPLGVVLKGGTWYLVAAVGEDLRVYRVSRVRGVDLLDETLERPPGFDLGAFWDSWATTYEAGVDWVTVRVRVAASFVWELPWAVGEHVRSALASARRARDGSVTLDLRYYSFDDARRSVLGMGTSVDVVRPARLRREVAAEARAVAERLESGT